MRNKASLLLLALLGMILVFALCAALCLQCFVAADRICEETALRDQAVLLAQNTAESLKAGHPTPQAPQGLTLSVTKLPQRISGLEEAEISVFDSENGSLLISITTGWQEVGK